MDSRRTQLRTHVIVEQAVLELIESRGGFLSDLLEANPDQDGTGDMVALDTCQTALTGFNASSLLGFAVKLLNFPAQGTHVLCILRGLLSKIVRGDKVRALRGKHQPEQFHAMAFGEILDMERFAMLCFPSSYPPADSPAL